MRRLWREEALCRKRKSRKQRCNKPQEKVEADPHPVSLGKQVLLYKIPLGVGTPPPYRPDRLRGALAHVDDSLADEVIADDRREAADEVDEWTVRDRAGMPRRSLRSLRARPADVIGRAATDEQMVMSTVNSSEVAQKLTDKGVGLHLFEEIT